MLYNALRLAFSQIAAYSRKLTFQFIQKLPIERQKSMAERFQVQEISPVPSFRKRGVTFSNLRMDSADPPISINDIFRNGINDDYINAVTQTNVELINVAYKEHYAKIQELVLKGAREGISSKLIGKEISNLTGVSKSKAEFWAQDQSSKFFGEVTRFNQTSAGYDGFIWRSVRDSRVRLTHRELEGKFFTWKDGSNVAHAQYPGRDYRCRCFAEPAFKDEYRPAIEAQYKAQAEAQRAQIAIQQAEVLGTKSSKEPISNNQIKTTQVVLQNNIQKVAATFIELFNLNQNDLSQITFRSMTASEIGLSASGLYYSANQEIAISLNEPNQKLTLVHELSHWLMDSIGISKIRNNPIFSEMIQIYKSGLPSNISVYYLEDEEIFSRIMEMYVANTKRGEFLNELNRKKKLYKIRGMGSLLDDSKFLKIKPMLENLLRQMGKLK